MPVLGERLRELREKGRLRQGDMASILEVSSALISTWETGHAMPPRRRLEQYAERFGGGDEDQLLQELLQLRLETVKGSARQLPREPPREPTMLDVLQDIRWLLVEIRDRLPKPE